MKNMDMTKVIHFSKRGHSLAIRNCVLSHLKAKEMKRTFKTIILIILTAVYIISAMGFSVQTHYCCGKKVSTSFWGKKNKCKCASSGKKMNGCCRDEVSFFKLKDEYRNSSPQITSKPFSEIFAIAFLKVFRISSLPQLPKKNISLYSLPPLIIQVPLFLRHRLLLI